MCLQNGVLFNASTRATHAKQQNDTTCMKGHVSTALADRFRFWEWRFEEFLAKNGTLRFFYFGCLRQGLQRQIGIFNANGDMEYEKYAI